MNAFRSRLRLIILLGFLLLSLDALGIGSQSFVSAYTPALGHQTVYDYGFVNTWPNLTASDILYWTTLNLTGSGYTLQWHQYVNLSITVAAVAPVLNVLRVLYDFSVIIHSNRAVVSNSSWQATVLLNGSAPAPAPTGVSSGSVDLPVSEGLTGFFLDDPTLLALHPGTDVTIGGSLWQSIAVGTFPLGEQEEACYALHNVTALANASIETTYTIDQDVGIYFHANETHTLAYGGVTRTLTYYHTVLATSVPLAPPPNPLPLLLVVTLGTIALVVVGTLFARALRQRRRRSRLPPPPESPA